MVAKADVYFGPFDCCPVDELPEADRKRWLDNLTELAELERHFWTNNPLTLDCFPRDRIRVWTGEQWDSLDVAAIGAFGDEIHREEVKKMPNGKLALLLEMMRVMAAKAANKEP